MNINIGIKGIVSLNLRSKGLTRVKHIRVMQRMRLSNVKDEVFSV